MTEKTVIENGVFTLSLTPQSKLEKKIIEDLVDADIDVKADYELNPFDSARQKHIIKISKKLED